ncbi:FadR/GntR family transcriptional regulator [Leucobacter chromiireducens]|uniref:FadR/GntR family transcriptional regulator n=1 Tax=Leucobacter chromiireducens TaxID=283877 RepID=UPI000F633FA3|nr:FadR/GntR family transcriptional regulator [Leucobacter chromiireducens]
MPEPVPQAPLQRRTAAEAAFQALLALIASDEIEIGDRLPGEIQLAKTFGVSRAILREALGACATLGLIETRSGSGTFVRSKTEHPQLTFGGYSAEDLIEARPHIEIPAAGYAAERHTEEQLAGLRGYVARMRQTTDLRAWVRLDGQFHRAIAEASGNPVLVAMVISMRQALDPQSEFLNITKARQSASDEEHERIIDAIASGSPEAARAAVAHHIAQVAEALAG